jgi:phytoene/squalene synthetase
MPSTIDDATAWCAQYLSERRHRDPLATLVRARGDADTLVVVYAFVRSTLDLAPHAAELDAWSEALSETWHRGDGHPVHRALRGLTRVPITVLRDLVDGARQRSRGERLVTAEHVCAQAAAIAGPLARLILHATGAHGASAYLLAERFATGLALVDDLADLGTDAAVARPRIADDEAIAFGVAADDLRRAPMPEPARDLVRTMAARARALVRHGPALARTVDPALRPLVAALERLGHRTLDRIEADPDLVAAEDLRRAIA